MHPLYHDFYKHFISFDKPSCLRFIMENMASKKIDILSLYEEILAPSLKSIASPTQEQVMPIWQEHLCTDIVETIISCCYPLLLEESPKLETPPRVVVFCPIQEHHRVGARMVSDYFALCGCISYYIGANTPPSEFIGALKAIHPKYIAISVTSFYNLAATKKTIEKIREQIKEATILVGGHAFIRNSSIAKSIGADLLLHSFQDIKGLVEKENQ